MSWKSYLIISIFMLILPFGSCSQTGYDTEQFRHLFKLEETELLSSKETEGSNHKMNFLEITFRFYKKHISPQDIMDCIYYPSCSSYAKETIQLNGLIGILDAIDRLTRCHLLGHENYPIHAESFLFYDPVLRIRKTSAPIRSIK